MNGTSELQLLLDTLQGDHGWIAAIGVWIGALRVALKPFGAQITSLLDRAIERARETDDTEDDQFILRVISSRWYRVLAFLLDLLASVKLPLSICNQPRKP
jgi:hypothetical protein